MASVKVIIYDPTGSKKREVELPDDVPASRLIPQLVRKMGLPAEKDGSPLGYILHRKLGLSGSDTLSSAGVKAGEDLHLSLE